ncbi:MAG: FMN-binding protein [Clostridia bacterium]|nr:FMN-binding protein [Clostridia bacterium]
MTKSNMFKPIVVLTLICLVLSAILVETNSVTAPIIEASELAAAEAARAEVLPEADSFTKVEGSFDERIIGVYKADNDAGYVVQVLEDGYGGKKTLSIMAGIDNDGLIVETKVLANNETPGLGSRIADNEFRGQFAGKDTSLEGIVTISGATISSGHFIDAMKDAFAAFEIAKEAN